MHCNVTSPREVSAFIHSQALSKSRAKTVEWDAVWSSICFFVQPRRWYARETGAIGPGVPHGGQGTRPRGAGPAFTCGIAPGRRSAGGQDSNFPKQQQLRVHIACTMTCGLKSYKLKQKTACAYHARVKRNKQICPRPSGHAVPYSAAQSRCWSMPPRWGG